jgi:4a-hydroxytetrahydrobiopterin dehydratase
MGGQQQRPSRERMAVGDVLARLPGWRAVEGRDAIARSFSFPDFVQAFAFMTRVALVAEKLDHHPDWSNAYGRVEVELTTHDVGGVTGFDLRLAQAMDEAAASILG